MKISDYITGIQHLGLPTRDIQKTIEFYKGLGFNVEFSTDGGEVAFLRLHDIVIETYQNDNAKMEYGAWDHIAINTVDIDSAYKAALESKYKIVEGINFLPFWENGVKYFTIEGPNKEKVEINQILKS